MKFADIPLTVGSFSLESNMVIPIAIVVTVAALVLIGARRELATVAIGAVLIGAVIANV